MFFRRVFSKKEEDPQIFSAPPNGRVSIKDTTLQKLPPRRMTSDEKQQKGLSVLQLTPLWEHIIRTHTLPEGLNIAEMFNEFYERLQDPEWQVRQHALRVLVDVLSVMRQNSDLYISRLIPLLIENLGHSAPAVRKGALDALRIYISESRIPDTVLVEIIELGMEQKSSNEYFTGRLAVGVMLALPPLIQPTLVFYKRNYILKTALHALSNKMIQVTYQEVAFKSILKIRDMIGPRDFNEFMPHKAKKDFDLLCSVYGVPLTLSNSETSDLEEITQNGDNRNAWRVMRDNNSDRQNNLWHRREFPTRVRREMENNTWSQNYTPQTSDDRLYEDSTDKSSSPASDENGNIPRQKLVKFSSIEILSNPENSDSPPPNSILKPHPSPSFIRKPAEAVRNNQKHDPNSPSKVSKMSPKRIKSSCERSRSTTPSPRRRSSSADLFGRSSSDAEDAEANINLTVPKCLMRKECNGIKPGDKVILETEIRLSDETAVTMRILESQTSHDTSVTEESEDDNSARNNNNSENAAKENSIMRVMSDSEVEDVLKDDDAIPRTPRRVRFGGEIVKMRTPDSDALNQSDTEDGGRVQMIPSDVVQVLALPSQPPMPVPIPVPTKENIPAIPLNNEVKAEQSLDKIKSLQIDIPNDNTKPLTPTRPKTAASPKRKTPKKNSPMLTDSTITSSAGTSPISPYRAGTGSAHRMTRSPIKSSPDKHRSRSSSPGKHRRRYSLTRIGANELLSPNPIHHEVQVLHNLVRSPSPSPTPKQRKNSMTSETQTDSNDQNTFSFSDRNTVQTQTSYNVATLISIPESKSGGVSAYSNSHEIVDSAAIQEFPKQWEELGIVDRTVLDNLKSGDWRLRSRGICALEDALKDSETLLRIQPSLESLLRTLLSSEKHPDVCEDKRRVLSNLISRLPLDNLENRIGQIMIGLCRQGGAGSNRVAKFLMQRLPPAAIVLRLLSDEFLHSRSARFRENALQMVLYALMTFPSTYFDITTCVGRATKAAIDRKKRVRQAALDVLAVLGQISSPKTVLDVVQNVVEHRQDSEHITAAVKARLSRKQLPLVGSDGSVQYSLRIPSPQSNSAINIFGADIEWIIAGSGSVSPTSLKKRNYRATSQPTQKSLNHNMTKYYDNSNSNAHHNTSKQYVQRAPHEMLAIGVGVKSPPQQSASAAQNGGDNSGNYVNGNHWRKNVEYYKDDEKNQTTQHHQLQYPHQQYIVATSIPLHQISTSQIINNMTSVAASNTQNLHSTKIQSRSFPELSASGNNIHNRKQKQQQHHNNSENTTLQNSDSDSGHRPSRLPVTVSRFPAMDKKQDPKLGDHNHMDSPYFPSQKLNGILSKASNYGSNINLPNNTTKTFKPDAHSSMRKQTSIEESNVENYAFGNMHYYEMKHEYEINNGSKNRNPPYEAQTQIENENNPAMDTFSLARSVSSIASQRTIENKSPETKLSQNPIAISSADVTTESDSDNSTPTRVIGTSNPALEQVPKSESILQQSSAPLSRPQSVILAVPYEKEEIDNTTRPKTANVVSYDDMPIRSKAASRESLPYDEIQINSRPASQNFNFDEEYLTPKDNVASCSSSMVSQDPFQRNENSYSHDPDEISSNSVETRTESDFEDEATQHKMLDTTESYTPKSNRTNKSYTSTEFGSDEKSDVNFDIDDIDFVKPLAKSPQKKSKAVIFRSKKIAPTTKSSIPTKTKPTEAYLSARRAEKPRDTLTLCLEQLDSSNWETTMSGIQLFVRLIRHHPQLVESQIHLVTIAIAKQVKSLRSQVARSACQAAGEFYTTHQKPLENESEDLVLNLLNRTADTNKFLRADAGRALDSMCDSLPPSKVIQILSTRGTTHQNAVIRTSTAKLFNRLVSRLGYEKVFAMNKECRDKIILNSANLLLEGSLETRNYAKEIFKQLSAHNNYSKIIFDVIPQRTYRNIEKSLKSIK